MFSVTDTKVFNCAVFIIHLLAKSQAKPKTEWHEQYYLQLEIIEHPKYIIKFFVTDLTLRTGHHYVCDNRRLKEPSTSRRGRSKASRRQLRSSPSATPGLKRSRAPREQRFL